MVMPGGDVTTTDRHVDGVAEAIIRSMSRHSTAVLTVWTD